MSQLRFPKVLPYLSAVHQLPPGADMGCEEKK